MEPRPSRQGRPRHPLDRSPGPVGPVPRDEAAGGQPTITTAGAFPPFGQDELVPSRTRRRRALARAILALLAVVAALGTLGAVYGEDAASWVGDRFDDAFDRGGDGDQGSGVPAAQTTPNPTPPSAAGVVASSTVAPSPTPAPGTPTELPAPPPADAAAASASEPAPPAETEQAPIESDAPAEPVPPIADLLPTVEDVPAGLEVTLDDERTEQQVADSFGDPADAAVRLEEWGWRQNLYRTFENPSGDAPDATTYIEVSLHRFRDADAVAQALPYFSDAVVAAQGLTDVQVDPIGDEVRALAGKPEGTANVVVLYVREGPVLIRLGGASVAGDPTDDLVTLARQIVER